MSNKLRTLSDEDVWARWNERMERVRRELHYVYGARRRFIDVAALFERNEQLKAIGGDVYDWLFRLWARDIVIAVRRELDNDTNTVCFRRLLEEMAQRPAVITRARYLRDIPDDDFRHAALWDIFDGYGVIRQSGTAPLTDYLDPVLVRADRDRLLDVSKPVRAYANQLVAHHSETEHVPVTLDDVNRTLAALEDVFTKYYAIVVGPSLVSLEPSIVHDWMAPFAIPWIAAEEA